MKKILLLSAALAAAGTALAAAPAFSLMDAASVKAGPKAPAMKKTAQFNTRADDELDVFDFSYSSYPYSELSFQGLTNGVSRVFMAFEMSADDIKTFAGSKVTGFTVYSPSDYYGKDNTILDGRFFYSTKPYLTAADYSQDFKMTSNAFSQHKIEISEPYTITGEEPALYFGYSVVVQDGMYYLPIDNVSNTPSAGLAGVCTDGIGFPAGFDSFGDSYGALCMSVTIEGHDFPKMMSFDDVPSMICLPLGKEAGVPIGLLCTSGKPISSFDIEYTMGGKEYSSTYEYDMPVPSGMNKYIGAQMQFPAINEKFKEDVEFRLTKLNGQPVTGEVSTATSTVRIVDEVPVRQTLVEEYTGTWCQYCPRGFAALEYIRENYPDFVVASFHSGEDTIDPMEVTQDFPIYVSGFPSASLNRIYSVDPHDGTTTYENLPLPIVGDIEDLNAIPTPWSVKVSHEWESDSLLTAKAEVVHMIGFENKNYRIAYLLVADGLTGKTTYWAQQNYYYRIQPDPEFIQELKDFCRGGKYGKMRVSGLTFNDVVVSPEGIHGVDGSIPTTLAEEEKAQHSFTFDLSKVPAELIPDKNKLRVIAAVVDAYGAVQNCAKDEVDDYVDTGVSGIDSENAPVEFYNINGVRIDRPTEGIFIRRQGSKIDKVMIR